MGKIGKALQKIIPEETLPEKRNKSVSEKFHFCCNYSLYLGNCYLWNHPWGLVVGFLAGVSLSMAILLRNFCCSDDIHESWCLAYVKTAGPNKKHCFY